MHVHFIVCVTSLLIKNSSRYARRGFALQKLCWSISDTCFIPVPANPVSLSGAELGYLAVGILAWVVSIQLKMQTSYGRSLVSTWAVLSIPFSLLVSQVCFLLRWVVWMIVLDRCAWRSRWWWWCWSSRLWIGKKIKFVSDVNKAKSKEPKKKKVV